MGFGGCQAVDKQQDNMENPIEAPVEMIIIVMMETVLKIRACFKV